MPELALSAPSRSFPPMTPDANQPAPRILVADDQADVLEALRLLLKGHGHHLAWAFASGRRAGRNAAFAATTPDTVA